MVGDEEEVLRIQSAKDSRPPILVKWWDDDMQPQGIVINKQKEDEELRMLQKALGQATRLVNVSLLIHVFYRPVGHFAEKRLSYRESTLGTRRKPRPWKN
jgi:hypothetical protein